jgi:Protein of unknown function (DUF3891)
MIVRYESDGSLVMITQNDHAKLSGLFAAHWGNEQFEKPRPHGSATRAAQYHDAGWLRYETKPHFNADTGKTPNFRQVPNDQTQLDSYQWALDWATAIDGYAGLLISKHRTGLWQSRYDVIKSPSFPARGKLSDGIEAFIARNEAKQKTLAAGLDEKELAINYHLLQVWDLLSLYVCTQERLKDECIDPVPTSYAGGEGVSVRLRPMSPTRISTEPFPFNQSPFEASLVYRRLPTSQFADAAAFEAAYFEASPQLASFTFEPARNAP